MSSNESQARKPRIEELRRVFNELDRNGNGVLEIGDIRSAFRELYGINRISTVRREA